MEKKPERHDPLTCDCMLLCEDVVQSIAYGKHTLSGVINQLLVSEVPAQVGPLALYIRLSNVQPSHNVHVEFGHADETIVGNPLPLPLPKNPDPFGVYTQIVRIPVLPLPAEGRYYLRLHVNGEPVLYTPLIVKVLSPPSGDGGSEDGGP